MGHRTLFTATAAGATLSKTLWPGSYTCTLPDPGGVASILNSTPAVVGGIFHRPPFWQAALLDFAGVGNADLTLAVEIGSIDKTGTLVRVLGSVSLKSITTSGTTTANINPFTGEATASTTWRLFDLVTITAKAQLNQIQVNVGGTEDDTPSQLILLADEAKYFYVMVTSLGTLTKAMCAIRPIEVGGF